MKMRKLPPNLPVDQAGTFIVVPRPASPGVNGAALGMGPAEIVAAVNHSLPSDTLAVRSSNYRNSRRRF